MRTSERDFSFVDSWSHLNATSALLISVVILMLISASTTLVYFTGGIKYVYAHSMYIPILGAALFFGLPGGTVAAILGGLALGPFMPLVTATGEMQSTFNWIFRLVLLTAIGSGVGIFMDVLRRNVRRIRWLSRHDVATELPNIVALQDYLASLEPKNRRLLLALVTPRNLNDLRATLGAETGPKLLSLLSDRVHEEMKLSWKLRTFHIEPDIIGVLFQCESVDDTRQVLERMERIMVEPYRTGQVSVHLDCAVGAAIAQAGPAAQALVRRAYSALMRGLATHQLITKYTRGLESITRESINLLGNLKGAIDDGQLRLVFQPKIDLRTKEPIGAEALLRWDHPRLGTIPPGKFLPGAEQTELINLITYWVLDQAVAFLRRLAEASFTLAVNISIRNLYARGFVQHVLGLVKRHRINPSRLELEITESAIMDNPEVAMKAITRLAEAGITISIDDFGTGYSSLTYLHRLPAGVIKIDREFIADMMREHETMIIANSSIQLSHLLGKKVVAEGIEDEETLNYLAERQCEYGQGYHISKPIEEAELSRWMKRSSAT